MSNQKSSVIGRAKLGNKPNYNAFDLSHRNCFTTSCGVLMPVQYAEVLPGEKFSISESHFTRAQNLITNSYGRFIESVQSYFIPYSSIFREYSMRVLDTAQKTMSGYNENRISDGVAFDPSTLSTQLPRLALSDVFRFCLVLDLMVYCTIKSTNLHLSECPYLIITNSGLLRSTSIARHMMSLGYGDWTPFFKDSEFALPMISFDSTYVSPEYGTFQNETYHVLDFLNMDKIKETYQSYKYLVSPMRLFAYHKIYNDFYRNDVWQPYTSSTCNLDYLNGSDLTVSIPWNPSASSDEGFFSGVDKVLQGITYTSVDALAGSINHYLLSVTNGDVLLKNLAFFDERPLNLPLDAINGVLPSPQYGNAAMVSINSANTVVAAQDDTYVAVRPSDNRLYGLTSNGDNLGNISLPFSVKDMRVAQSLQKYKEISASRENYFVDQIGAHFGVEYTKDPFVTKFLGGSSNVIQVDTQVNTNLAGDNNAVLGGIASAQGQFKCNGVADDYGLVLTLHGIYPIVDYPNIALDSQVLSVDGSDIPIPEFDNNGFEGHRCINSIGNLNARYVQELETPTSVYGYCSRYFDYKVSKDVANGAFLTTLKDKLMSLNTLDDKYMPIIKRTLLASPRLCDNIFANQHHSTIDDDQFYTNMICGLSVIRPFSVHSLPFAN
jgi:hypothetical protein